MVDESRFFKVLALKGTGEILMYVEEHERARYKDLDPLASTYTLSTRLRELLKFRLIEHHFVKEDIREEWYEITDRGRSYGGKVMGKMKCREKRLPKYYKVYEQLYENPVIPICQISEITRNTP